MGRSVLTGKFGENPWGNHRLHFFSSKINLFSKLVFYLKGMLGTSASDEYGGYKQIPLTLYLKSKAISLGIGQI